MAFKAPNKIPQAQFEARLKAIMPHMIQAGKAESRDQLKELFNLHNDRYPKKTKLDCCSCRATVFRRMKSEYENII